MDRRIFVRRLAGAAVAGGCAPVLAACAGLPYAATIPVEGGVSISRTQLADKDYLLVALPGESAPAFLSRQADGSYTAVSLRCTHRGCTVQPSGAELECPCHGSRFRYDGARLDGPAPRDLPSYRVEETDTALILRLS